jgi:hypothetical protein
MNPAIKVQRRNKHGVWIGLQRIARRVGGGIDLVDTTMNVTHHND